MSNTDQNKTEQKSYLEIPEFGVKISVSENIPDMYYIIKTKTNGNEYTGDRYAVLSSKSLATLEPDCAAENISTGGVEGAGLVISYTNPDAPSPFEGSTMRDVYPKSLQVSEDYYTITPNLQGVCWDDDKYKDMYETSEVTQKSKALTNFLQYEAVLEKL